MKKLFALLTLAILLIAVTTSYAKDLKLSWDASPGADGYRVQICTLVVEDGVIKPVWSESRDAGPTTTFMWTGAIETELLLFRASAYNNTGEVISTTTGAWYCGSWVLPEAATGLGIE